MSELSKEIKLFAERMQFKLEKNRHKGGWDRCPIASLMNRADEEKEEFIESCKDLDYEQAMNECADVANFWMMIHDKLMKRRESEAVDGK